MRGTTVRHSRKRHRMRKKGYTDIRAALKLIAAENLNALRNLLRNIASFVSRPGYLDKKT
jgi:hypothetical protein